MLYSSLVTDMNLLNLKKEIEEKSIALEELLLQCEKEEKKLFLFKSEKKIKDLHNRISALNDEIGELEKAYNTQLELKKAASDTVDKVSGIAKKNGKKLVIGCIAACLGYFGYLFVKPLNINGEQTTYRSAIGSFENLEINAEDYTPETYEQFIQNLEDAEAQKSNIFMSDEEKAAYINELTSAFDELEPMPDKTGLLSALNKAESYDVSAYTPATVESFKSLISQIRVIYDDLNATEKEVADAENNVADAYRVLALRADKTELIELFEKYTAFVLDDYTPSSARSFTKEIQNTEDLINNENASQDKVDQQVETLQTIETLLVKRADKSSLKSLIDECNKLDGSKYKEGYDTLLSRMKSSSELLNNDDVTQEEVDTAVSRLKQAKSDLVEYIINVYRINMRASLQRNNSVGNEWSYARYYNDKSVHDGFEVTGEPGSSVEVGMEIIERDNSPDVGYESATITLKDGYQTSFDVIVTENRGRYSGNEALFKVYVTVTYLRKG